jgi:spoIIIJ-associated protein
MSESDQEFGGDWEEETESVEGEEGLDDEALADEAAAEPAAEEGEPAHDGQRRRRRRRGNGGGADWVPEGDDRALAALEFVSQVVKEMEMDCRVRLRRPKQQEEDDGTPPEINIEITGPDAGRVIGKKGQVLMALQFLVHRVVNRSGLEKRHVLVDAEGYRNRRDNSLASMARRLGKQAVEQGKIITFEPMNPRDRRVVHLALAKFEGVITKSDGEGASRRVQIIPVRRTSAQS